MGSAIGTIIYLAFVVAIIAAMWKIFVKANQPGWGAIIPIYNTYLMLKIIGRPAWWIILLFIPFVNLVIGIIMALDIAKSFGKGVGFGIGLIIPLVNIVCILILGFGDARYVGPAASANRTAFAA